MILLLCILLLHSKINGKLLNRSVNISSCGESPAYILRSSSAMWGKRCAASSLSGICRGPWGTRWDSCKNRGFVVLCCLMICSARLVNRWVAYWPPASGTSDRPQWKSNPSHMSCPTTYYNWKMNKLMSRDIFPVGLRNSHIVSLWSRSILFFCFFSASNFIFISVIKFYFGTMDTPLVTVKPMY